jgi:hypothetical protein
MIRPGILEPKRVTRDYPQVSARWIVWDESNTRNPLFRCKVDEKSKRDFLDKASSLLHFLQIRQRNVPFQIPLAVGVELACR